MIFTDALGCLISIFRTNISEFKKTWALASLNLRKEYAGSILGIVWAIGRPLTYVVVFAFAIQVGIKGSREIGDTPFLLWLIPGTFTWFFLSETLKGCGKSLQKNKHLVTKMVFPVATIPVIEVLTEFFVHIMLMILIVIIFLVTGYGVGIYFLQLPYYLLCSFLFGCTVATLLSALTAVSRDVSHLMISINQALFWLSPILWPIKNINNPIVLGVMKLNPVAYLVEGYRNVFVYQRWFFQDYTWMILFWCILGTTMLASAFIWSRLSDDFADVL